MEEQDAQNASGENPDNGGDDLPCTGVSGGTKQSQSRTATSDENHADEKLGHANEGIFRKTRDFFKRLVRASPDRIIELMFAFVVVIFSGSQLYITYTNNKGTTQQTDQLIAAAKISAYAAQQSLLASRNFADSAQGINEGVGSAVDKLNLQAASTKALAEEAVNQAKAAESQAFATQEIAKQAAAAGRTSAQQLESSERPWMEFVPAFFLDGTHPSPVYIDPDGSIRINVVMNGLNSGHSPAISVNAEADVVIDRNNEVADGQKRLCQEISAEDKIGHGDTIFPQRTFQIRRFLRLSKDVRLREIANPSNRSYSSPTVNLTFAGDPDGVFREVEALTAKNLGAKPASTISVIGCLNYTVDYSGREHQTAFQYDIVGFDFESGEASKMVFIKHLESGNKAN